ncbi:MAG: trehalose-6-phosphate synthase, partial [Smithella sp.]
MKTGIKKSIGDSPCGNDPEALLRGRSLIVVSNRGPVSFSKSEDGGLQLQRNGGGLVTALLGLAQNVDITWIASAIDELEKNWGHGKVLLDEAGRSIDLDLVPLEESVYDGYYNVISNPLLWFLQHSMWDFVTNPTINRDTWKAWDQGYVVANNQFALTLADHIQSASGRVLVMLQDYHLYLVPRMLRRLLHRTRRTDQVTLTHFIHIPWPGQENIHILPSGMRQAILDGMAAVDLLGFQTQEDVLNFLRSAESHLPGASVNYKHRRIWYRNHATMVRDFPISIDVQALQSQTQTEETIEYRRQFEEIINEEQMILRVDRTEPSKNIVRGFQAFGEMLELHPEHIGNVKFIALLVPSRLEVDEYRNYHDELMAAAGWVNSKYGAGDWEPIRVILGDNYSRAVAALQLYDVLLVNSIADGMNLVAKEGPVVNQKDGVLVLSEMTGASQQLESGALVISPCDVYATAEALHQALTMPASERQIRAN